MEIEALGARRRPAADPYDVDGGVDGAGSWAEVESQIDALLEDLQEQG